MAFHRLKKYFNYYVVKFILNRAKPAFAGEIRTIIAYCLAVARAVRYSANIFKNTENFFGL